MKYWETGDIYSLKNKLKNIFKIDSWSVESVAPEVILALLSTSIQTPKPVYGTDLLPMIKNKT